MRIHTTADRLDVATAARKAGIYLEKFNTHGSRSHRHAFEVIASGESPHRINSGKFGHEYAASWDQWGIFLAAIYAVDPTAKSWAYTDADDFHAKTGHRFDPDRSTFVPAGSTAVDSVRHPDYRRTSHRLGYVTPGDWTGPAACTLDTAAHPACGLVVGR